MFTVWTWMMNPDVLYRARSSNFKFAGEVLCNCLALLMADTLGCSPQEPGIDLNCILCLQNSSQYISCHFTSSIRRSGISFSNWLRILVFAISIFDPKFCCSDWGFSWVFFQFLQLVLSYNRPFHSRSSPINPSFSLSAITKLTD